MCMYIGNSSLMLWTMARATGFKRPPRLSQQLQREIYMKPRRCRRQRRYHPRPQTPAWGFGPAPARGAQFKRRQPAAKNVPANRQLFFLFFFFFCFRTTNVELNGFLLKSSCGPIGKRLQLWTSRLQSIDSNWLRL